MTKTTSENAANPLMQNSDHNQETVTQHHSRYGMMFWMNFLLTLVILFLMLTLCLPWRYSLMGYRINSLMNNQLDVTKQSAAANTAQDELHSIVKRLETSVHLLQQELTTVKDAASKPDNNANNDIWLIKEAQYETNLAQTQLQFQGRVATAVQLLQSADSRLKLVNNPKVTATRKVLADQIAAINNAPQTDIVGTLSQLHAMNAHLKTLPFANAMHAKQDLNNNPQKNNTEATSATWRDRVNSLGNQLKTLVVIEHQDKTMKPLLSQSHADLVVQIMQLYLNQASYALMTQNAELYQQNLDDSIAMLKQYFDLKAAATKTMLQKLEQFKQLKINPDVVDLSPSLNSINQLLI